MPRVYGPVPSITDNGIHAEVAACTACPLHLSCPRPVGPVGPRHAAVMFVAEAPARYEAQYGIPLTGPTWPEMEHYLKLAGLSRDTVWLSNAVMCPILKHDPVYADTQVCWSTWKPVELAAVNPQILVVMGQLSLRALLGDPKATVEEWHGFPFRYQVGNWEGWVLNTYHPAAGIHAASYLPALREDFLALLDLKRGIVRERPIDHWAGREVYARVDAWPF